MVNLFVVVPRFHLHPQRTAGRQRALRLARETARGTSRIFFQWHSFPISIRDTLQSSSNDVGFIPLCKRKDSKKTSSSNPSDLPPTVETSGTPMKPKRTILCVDDNEQSLSIRKVLLETRGYRVVTCQNGDEALARFKRGGIDLILADLIMPGLDGAKLIEEIKSLSPRTPAILLSGKVRIYDRDTQADVFLPKGMYAPAELLERIRLLLVRKRGPSRALPRTQASGTRANIA
jgi:two-component system response regulator CpxR